MALFLFLFGVLLFRAFLCPQAVTMFRLEVFLAILFSGLLLSEIVENISRAALRMYRF